MAFFGTLCLGSRLVLNRLLNDHSGTVGHGVVIDCGRIVPVAYRDSNGNQSSDCLRSNRTADRPCVQQTSNRPVHDFAFVTVEQTNQTETMMAEET